MKALLKITKEIIDTSERCNPYRCAIANSAKDLFPDAHVGIYTLFFNEAAIHSRLPQIAIDFRRNFDSGMFVQPISFEIDVPDSIIDQIGIGQVMKILSESKTLEHVNPLITMRDFNHTINVLVKAYMNDDLTTGPVVGGIPEQGKVDYVE